LEISSLKILLLNPAVDFDKQFGTLKDFYTPIPSIGLAYIGAVLREADFEVEGLDSFMACHTSEQMYDEIVKAAPDVLGISLLTPCAPLVDPLLPRLKEALPELIVVLGNIHGSKFDSHYIESRMADYAVHHEGEMTMLELMQRARDGEPISDVKGITYLDEATGKAVRTQTRPWIEKGILDEMPYPAWDIFPVERFKPDIRLLGKTKLNKNADVQALPLLSSRGCPWNCTFCSPVNTIGNKYRQRTPKSVVDEMEYWYRRWGVTTFYNMDLTFPISEKKGLEFCEELISRNLPLRWGCETRVNAVTYKLLKRMKESGCFRVDYGIECGNQKMLDLINKKFTIQQVRDAVEATDRAGVESEGLFIIGLPGETPDDTHDTIEFALSLPLDHIKLNLFVPYPGSDLWDSLEAGGELTNFDFNEYTSYPSYTGGRVPYTPKGRTHAELVRLQSCGMRRAMFRWRVIARELRNFKLGQIHQYWNAVTSLLFPTFLDERNTIGAATYSSDTE
jgi:anaerobic magnesium-protoporphyrin IX monomethyl ester cyclase